MKPSYYMDIDARRSANAVLHDTMSFLVQKLHHAKKLGQIALAFPTIAEKPGLGDKIRVFAEDPETLTKIADFLAEDWRTDDYAIVRHPKPVPGAVLGYEAYFRFRVNQRISDSRAKRLAQRGSLGAISSINAEMRQKKICALRERRDQIKFATIWSASTRRQFNLYIERKMLDGKPFPSGEPDGYGLSRAGNVVPLPVF